MCTVDDIKKQAVLGEFNNVQPASLLTKKSQPFVLQDLMSLAFKVNYGVWQQVIFNAVDFSNIATATASEVASVINAQTTDLIAIDLVGKVLVSTLIKGELAILEVEPGTANKALGFPLSAQGIGISDGSIEILIERAMCKHKGYANCGCFCKLIALWVLHSLYLQNKLGLFSGKNGKIGVGEVKQESLGPASRGYVTSVDLGIGKANTGDFNSSPYGAEYLDLKRGAGVSTTTVSPPWPPPRPCI